LTMVRNQWGGSLSPYNKTLRRPAWNWQASAGRGYTFLCDIRPWLFLKAEQVDLVLAWWPTRPQPQRGANGRMLCMAPEARTAEKRVAQALKDMKREA
jgi:hypothetical protein